MRHLFLALLVFPATSAFAQNKDPDTGSPIYAEWQLLEYAANTKKCFKRQPDRLRNKLELRVTIGADGMIVGVPVVLSPIDSADFRADVKTALKNLWACQPYFVDPFRRVRRGFIQVFRFGYEEPPVNRSMSAAIQETFDKCWKPPPTGPTVWLKLTYERDGTLRQKLLVNPKKSEEYARAASTVLRQIEKCPPVQFPEDVDLSRSIDWPFPSSESTGASKRRSEMTF